MNGDGWSDVVVGAPLWLSGRGAAYLYHGSSAGISNRAAQGVFGASGYLKGASVASVLERPRRMPDLTLLLGLSMYH